MRREASNSRLSLVVHSTNAVAPARPVARQFSRRNGACSGASTWIGGGGRPKGAPVGRRGAKHTRRGGGGVVPAGLRIDGPGHCAVDGPFVGLRDARRVVALHT